MAEPSCIAEVRLWDHTVGAVAELDDGRVIFEYDSDFRRTGLEISPIHLPLQRKGAVEFPELRRLPAFEGLPGVLADALPDRFGNAVIRRYFTDRGRPDDAMSPVQKLLYIGSRAMGALEFRPAHRIPRNAREEEALEVSALVAAARRVVEGSTEIAVPEIIRLGSSAGGARAKAVILWNRKSNEVRSAFASPRPGDEEWLIKFDGVGELDVPDPEPRAYNRIEHAYSVLARKAGIEMAETHLLEERGLGHFMTRRFDRTAEGRLHIHTLGGMEHVDYNRPGLYACEQLLRLTLTLQLGYPALAQAFRRISFNILAVNQDDHVKNFGFVMDGNGKWSLSPAYDLTFARGGGYTRRHQISLGRKFDRFTAGDLLDLGRKFGIERDGREIVREVGDALSGWPAAASAAGVPEERIKAIGDSFRIL